jgi:fumarate hydratase class II
MTETERRTTRTERDSMGEMEVPADALYGASTRRAVLNFPISGQPLPRRFVRALALIKQAAADANRELGLLPGSDRSDGAHRVYDAYAATSTEDGIAPDQRIFFTPTS